MTAWNELRQVFPEVALAVDLARETIRPQQRSDDVRYFQDIGMSLRAASIAAETGAPNGVYGVGAWLYGTRVVPAIFVQPGLGRTGALANRAPVRFLAESSAVLAGFRVVALPPASEYAVTSGTGASARAGMRRLTLGAAGSCSGSQGWFTAGHAAPDVGGTVRAHDGSEIGRVVATVSRASHPTLGPTADIAFVASRSATVQDKWASTSVAAALPRDSVLMMTSRGTFSATIRGLSPDFIVDQTTPSWGEVLLTTEDLAQAGDSGSAVLSQIGELVGHIVGGSGHDYTIIQDAEYQLGAINATVL